MDFSSLISKEINRKRKQLNAENVSKKNKISISSINKASQDNGIDNSHNILECQASYDKIKDDSKDVTSLATDISRGDHSYSNETSDEQGNAELYQFDATDNTSFNKLKRLQKAENVLHNEEKRERYKLHLDNEAKTDKEIKKEELPQKEYREKIFLQVRINIKLLIKEWDESSGGADKDLILETKKDLVKLLYKLRAKKVSDDMLISLGTILYYIQIGDYLKANEAYMKLSIGNVAWPIGVQSVGIHARSASSKITGQKTASNIMIDDKTRRWITAVKRLITFSENLHTK